MATGVSHNARSALCVTRRSFQEEPLRPPSKTRSERGSSSSLQARHVGSGHRRIRSHRRSHVRRSRSLSTRRLAHRFPQVRQSDGRDHLSLCRQGQQPLWRSRRRHSGRRRPLRSRDGDGRRIDASPSTCTLACSGAPRIYRRNRRHYFHSSSSISAFDIDGTATR